MESALERITTGPLGNMLLERSARGSNQPAALVRPMALASLQNPDVSVGVVPCFCDASVELDVFVKVPNVGDVSEVATQFFVCRETFCPTECAPNSGIGKAIVRKLAVDSGARISLSCRESACM